METTEGSVSLTLCLLGSKIYWLKSIHSFLVLGLLKTQVTVHQNFDELKKINASGPRERKWAGEWMWCPLCGQVGPFTVFQHALSTVCILVSAFKEPQRTQAGRPIFSLLLGLLTTQEKGFQTEEACNFNTFNCLWPFRSPHLLLELKAQKNYGHSWCPCQETTVALLIWVLLSYLACQLPWNEDLLLAFWVCGGRVSGAADVPCRVMPHHGWVGSHIVAHHPVLWHQTSEWPADLGNSFVPSPHPKYSLSLIQLLQWVDLICSRCPKI